MDDQVIGSAEEPWHAAFPAPRSVAEHMAPEDFLQLLQNDTKLAGRDYLAVDLRRMDHEVR